MKRHRLAHLTSVHSRGDIRIFGKECRSLAAHGYDVTLVVADGLGDGQRDGVKIIDAGKLPGRLNRMFRTTGRVYDKAAALDADLYHLHDPELIPIGLRLKRLGKRVVFDSHEDVSRQMYSRTYLGPVSQRVLSVAFSLFERYACRRLDGIVAATPFIRDKFLAIHPRTLDIDNYPFVGELDASVRWEEKREEVCYVGGISAERGICEVVRAFELLKTGARLNLAGTFSEPGLEAEMKACQGWSRVNEYGFVDRVGVRELMGRSLAGLVTFRPEPNHVDAQPNKMFEYMSAGIPVIASDFPPWRAIIVGNDCGLCVDPLDPKAIAAAIDRLVENPDLARRMGENGRAAVLGKYNWSTEERKLLDFVAGILGEPWRRQ
jgi:glycosyltransferase involved in cell wall biosynthesis